MKTAAVLALSLSIGTFAIAQDRNLNKPKTPAPQNQQQSQTPPDQQPPENQQQMKRLDSVTWNVDSHKLVWVVETGYEVDGNFQAASTQKYEITPDDAVMAFSNEKRGFTAEEAKSLSHLLDVLTLYCVESVVWWDQGMGDPIDPNAPSGSPRKQQEQPVKPKRVEKPTPRTAPLESEIAQAAGVR